MSGALFIAIRQLVLAGLPTTSTFTSSAASSFSALPCTVKILPFSESSSARSMPFVRGREPTSSAMLTPSNAVGRVVVQVEPREQRKRAVDELHRHALQRAHRGWYLQQAQIDRLLGTEQLPAGDAEHEAVADLAGGARDGDSYWFAHWFISCLRFSSIDARNSSVVCHSCSGPTSSARSLVI